MKITDVEAITLRQPVINEGIADGSQDDLLVRVHTNEGLVGIGEVDSAPEIVKAVIQAHSSHLIALSLRDALIGEDPNDVERLWQKMYRASIFYGRRGVAIHAMSGIDIALWDIRGQALGKPISELIGKPVRDRVRAYASRLMPATESQTKEAVAELRDQGFTAIKLGWGPLGKDPKHDIRLATAAREAAGDQTEILIDAGLGYGRDAKTAIAVAHELETLGVFWLEEPFEPDEYEAYAELADTVGIRIAAGEQDVTFWGFRELVDRGHVDVVQPDVTRCGGITETMRIVNFANKRGLDCVLHAWKSGIIKAASLHIDAVMPASLFQEYCVAQTPINQELTVEKLPIDAEGFLTVPRGAGLGVTLNEQIVERYRVS